MNVGKTSVLSQYVHGMFVSSPLPTIAVELKTKVITLRDGSKVKAQIWDTAGMEKYKSVTCHHYKKANGAILVYDVTNRNSFLNIKRWLKEILENTDLKCVVFIIGNKVDLVEKNQKLREVSYEEGLAFSKINNLNFFETSACTNKNIHKVFLEMIEKIKLLNIEENSINIRLGNKREDFDSNSNNYLSIQREGTFNQNKVSCCGY